jgi:Fuc2NAc and GlcNAc transferase
MGYYIIYFLVFISSSLGVLLYLWFAKKKAIFDLPNERSLHVKPTPRGGGVAVSIIWFLAITLFFINNEIDSTLFLALICGIPISVIGLVDDIITISPKVRFSVQLVSATLALVILGGMNSIDLGIGRLNIPIVLEVFAIVGIVWFTNLFNFLDGIDGYLSVEVMFIGLVTFILYGCVPPFVLAIITAGFLVWNWHPAKIFMGDVGSTLLGFSIGIFTVYYQNTSISSIFIWLMITSLFWFDATLTLFRRWRNKEVLSSAHKKHAYQRIVQSGFSHQKTVIYSFFINLIIMGLVFIALIFPKLLLPVFFINISFLYLIVKIIDKRYPFSQNHS